MSILNRICSILSFFILLCCWFTKPLAAKENSRRINNIVFIHDGFAAMNFWSKVSFVLERNGYDVKRIYQQSYSSSINQLLVESIIHSINGPILVVNCSYGNMYRKEKLNDPKVKKIIFIDMEKDVISHTELRIFQGAHQYVTNMDKGGPQVKTTEGIAMNTTHQPSSNANWEANQNLSFTKVRTTDRSTMIVNWSEYKTGWRLLGVKEPAFLSSLINKRTSSFASGDLKDIFVTSVNINVQTLAYWVMREANQS